MSFLLYLDSAQRADVEPMLATGVFAGVTTNPTILDRAGLTGADIPAVYGWAVAAGAREVFAQAWGTDVEALVQCGRRLRGVGDRMTVKLAATAHGLAAAGRLTEEGVPVLLTVIYAVHQAATAAALGVRWIAPYLGRMADADQPARDQVRAMQAILNGTGGRTAMLAASVRALEDVEFLAGCGAAAVTMPVPLARRLLDVPATAAAAAAFDAITDTWPS